MLVRYLFGAGLLSPHVMQVLLQSFTCMAAVWDLNYIYTVVVRGMLVAEYRWSFASIKAYRTVVQLERLLHAVF